MAKAVHSSLQPLRVGNKEDLEGAEFAQSCMYTCCMNVHLRFSSFGSNQERKLLSTTLNLTLLWQILTLLLRPPQPILSLSLSLSHPFLFLTAAFQGRFFRDPQEGLTGGGEKKRNEYIQREEEVGSDIDFVASLEQEHRIEIGHWAHLMQFAGNESGSHLVFKGIFPREGENGFLATLLFARTVYLRSLVGT